MGLMTIKQLIALPEFHDPETGKGPDKSTVRRWVQIGLIPDDGGPRVRLKMTRRGRRSCTENWRWHLPIASNSDWIGSLTRMDGEGAPSLFATSTIDQAGATMENTCRRDAMPGGHFS